VRRREMAPQRSEITTAGGGGRAFSCRKVAVPRSSSRPQHGSESPLHTGQFYPRERWGEASEVGADPAGFSLPERASSRPSRRRLGIPAQGLCGASWRVVFASAKTSWQDRMAALAGAVGSAHDGAYLPRGCASLAWLGASDKAVAEGACAADFRSGWWHEETPGHTCSGAFR